MKESDTNPLEQMTKELRNTKELNSIAQNKAKEVNYKLIQTIDLSKWLELLVINDRIRLPIMILKAMTEKTLDLGTKFLQQARNKKLK